MTVPALSVAAFLDALADGTPAPGGGGAAALVTATAAALVAMVARVAERHAAGDAVFTSVIDDADRVRAQALRLIDEDGEAYRAVVAARRVGGDRVVPALVRATETPLAVAVAAADVLDLAGRVTPGVRASTGSDVAVAAWLAWAAIQAASCTARANLADCTDHVFADAAEGKITRLLERGTAARQRVLAAIGGGA
jgi:formiminotetrahydrofolate cyclodeaminase